MIQALVALVNDPEPEHPLRADLAEEYTKDRKKFMKNAEEFTKKYSEKRTERLGWSVGDVTFSPSLPPSPTLNARNSTLLSYSILHQPAHPYRPSQQYQNLDSIWINKKIGAVRSAWIVDSFSSYVMRFVKDLQSQQVDNNIAYLSTFLINA